MKGVRNFDKKVKDFTKNKKRKTKNQKRKVSIHETMAYDDAGKTLLHDCPFLIIPVVNEAFDEHYTGEEKIEFLREGEVLNLSENETLRNYKDGYFRIIGKECAKIYHIELQSVTDTTMVLRMFEYDMASAIKESVLENDKLTVQICDSAVVFLRHGDAIPDAMTIELITPGGNVSYDVKVVKIRHYSLDEIFEKKLLFLLPFYIFCYENRFKELEEQEDKLALLVDEYAGIVEKLNCLRECGEITEYDKNTIVSMMKKVVRNLAKNKAKVKKEVMSVMGGRVVKHEAQVLRDKGIKIGIELERKNTEAERMRAEKAEWRLAQIEKYMVSKGLLIPEFT